MKAKLLRKAAPLYWIGSLISLGFSSQALSAAIDLTQVPLASATTTLVKPNLMFILDNSGSMAWDFTPDHAGPGQDSTSSYMCSTGSGTTTCSIGDPPRMSSDFNYQYYNPAINYTNGVDSYGHPYNAPTSVSSDSSTVYVDAYDTNQGTINLTNSYPDLKWCNTYWGWGQVCKTNSNYTYPNSTYKYSTSIVGNPYYYTIQVSEYCTDNNLTSCQATADATHTVPAKMRWCNSNKLTTCQAKRTPTFAYPRYLGSRNGSSTLTPYTFVRTDIVPSNNSYPKASTRTDCAGSTCTYNEELANFARWYTYYRTRIQMMKSAAGQAFSYIGSNFRVGFTTINSDTSNFLAIQDFDTTQKGAWYAKFYAIDPSGGTPLRTELTKVGRMFAGQHPFNNSDDPMQYSCQQNFALITTDGWWNDSDSGPRLIDGSQSGVGVGNPDHASGVVTPYFDGANTSTTSCVATSTSSCKFSSCTASHSSYYSSCNTLADAAYYYYWTDLRTPDLRNCTGAAVNGTSYDVCANNVPSGANDTNQQQHMTLFTLGLGVDGYRTYTSDYLSATSGDYYAIKQGTLDWPQVLANNISTVDDLWHAAVNGKGQYFSAKNPTTLSNGLNSALAGVSARLGSGAAAATSNLQPVAGDNYAYIGSYTSVKWYGNLESRSVDVNTGVIAPNANWCVSDITANATTGATACTGQLKSQVGSRNIYFFKGNASNKLSTFSYTNLSSTQQCYFNVDPTSSNPCAGKTLSQYPTLSSNAQAASTGTNLVEYLKGSATYEMRDSNSVDQQVFRARDFIFGDVVDSQPVYVKKPYYSYTDPGYSAFKSNSTRGGTVYIGSNDGMLHAFNADTGQERWAYVPSQVMSQMYRLADANYSSSHHYYVNGSPTVSDVCTANCNSDSATWKTILVAPLNGGGFGYYALDVTNPDTPIGLWEVDNTTDPDFGYSYGSPIFTKDASGNWVLLATSGYNNVSSVTTGASGRGVLFVMNPMTGSVIRKIATSAGDTTTSSGLAKIAAWTSNPMQNNQASYVYGGDLLGNVWRFDFNGGTATKITQLTDPSGTAQPITTVPELTTIQDGNGAERTLYFVTGKYLSTADLSNTQTQTVYGFKDLYDINGVLTTPRSTLVKQTIVNSGTNSSGVNIRSVSSTSNAADMSGTDWGWYVDLPESGERGNVDPILVAGSLVVASNVPESSACTTGGHSWFNIFDYKKGATSWVSTYAGNAMIVGFVVLQTSGGLVISPIMSDGSGGANPPAVPWKSANGTVQGFRATWRQLP